MIKNIVIIVLLFISVYLFLNPKKEVEFKTITNTIMVTDSNYTQIVDTLKLIDLPANIDTMQVINDYYSKFNYKRNYEDKYINIVLNDTVYQNKIFAGNLSYTIKDFPVKKQFKYGVGLNYLNTLGVGVNMQYFKNNLNYSVYYYPSSNIIGVGVVYCF